MTLPITPCILGIAEKPQAAKRLAYALDSSNSPKLIRYKGVPIYQCSISNFSLPLIVVPALGHLFSLTQIGKSWSYPTLDFEWLPLYKINKKSKTKSFIDVFSKLSRYVRDVIVMTDFDREGEVIGYLILHQLLKRNNASRMKFSTLTKRDILQAFKQRDDHLDYGFLNSGLLRHYIDWLFGINYSRALSLAIQRVSKQFSPISIGRVQGPTLKFVVDREREINYFIPVPYWKIKAIVKIGNKSYSAQYEKEVIKTLSEAEKIVKDCSSLKGSVTSVDKKLTKFYPFPPFNLSDLQREAFRFFGFSPAKTLEIAEKLYLQALISYPRTDSQKLPLSLGHKTILSKLSQNSNYSAIIEKIFERNVFKPIQGKKTDPAHPAIHPTGNLPDNSMSPDENKLYDLITKRYLSVFGAPAKKVEKSYTLSINKHNFYLVGYNVIEKGWIDFYEPYYTVRTIDVPELMLNDTVFFATVSYKDYFTSPPLRYNEATLLEKMEKEKIGTKATRAAIIKTLFDRRYIIGKSIIATPLGETVVEVLEQHYPTLIKPEMTRQLEELMDFVQQENKEIEEIVFSIKVKLFSLLKQFHRKESTIGIELYKNIGQESQQPTINLGRCPKCKKGTLRVLTAKKTGKRFIACSAYFDPKIKCDLTFPLPPYGTLTSTEKLCPYDELPLLKLQSKNRAKIFCINPECKYNKESSED